MKQKKKLGRQDFILTFTKFGEIILVSGFFSFIDTKNAQYALTKRTFNNIEHLEYYDLVSFLKIDTIMLFLFSATITLRNDNCFFND